MTYLALKSVNGLFADYFNSEEDSAQLKSRFLQTFWESYFRLPDNGKVELSKYSVLECLEVRKFPEPGNYQEIIDGLDNIYFDAEDAGEKEKSDLFFRLARFVSAIQFYYKAGVEDRYMSAVYEALFSAEDSKKFAQEMTSLLT